MGLSPHILREGQEANPGQGAAVDHAHGRTPARGEHTSCPSPQTHRRLRHPGGAGDLPTGQHLPRGMGESQAEGHKGWGRVWAQLCTAAQTGE